MHGEVTSFRAGDRFDSLFEIWTGFFKTVIATNQGREQVTGFQMGGELLGVDGIDSGRYPCGCGCARGRASLRDPVRGPGNPGS